MLLAPSVTASVQLRPGELQVARLAAEGLSDREISERLHLSIGTVGKRSVAQLPQIGISGRDEQSASLAHAERLTA